MKGPAQKMWKRCGSEGGHDASKGEREVGEATAEAGRRVECSRASTCIEKVLAGNARREESSGEGVVGREGEGER